MNWCKKFIKYMNNIFSCCKAKKEEDPRNYTYYKMDNSYVNENPLYRELTFENVKSHNHINNCYKRKNEVNYTSSESLDSLCYENYYDNINF